MLIGGQTLPTKFMCTELVQPFIYNLKLSIMKQVLTMVLLIAVTTAAVFCSGTKSKSASANATDSTSKMVYLNQGWSAEDRAEYYWAPQGSALLSYDIYLALKDPETKTL